MSARTEQGLFKWPSTVEPALERGSTDTGAARPFSQRVGLTVEGDRLMGANWFIAPLGLMRSDWSCECPLNAVPVLGQTFTDEVLVEPELVTPLLQSLSAPLEGKQPVAGAVVLLFLDRNPAAVSWGIISSGIDAVELMLWAGLLAHVFNEVPERVQPALANTNALCAIILVVLISVAIAPRAHRIIGLVQRMLRLVHGADPEVDDETMSLPHNGVERKINRL